MVRIEAVEGSAGRAGHAMCLQRPCLKIRCPMAPSATLRWFDVLMLVGYSVGLSQSLGVRHNRMARACEIAEQIGEQLRWSRRR